MPRLQLAARIPSTHRRLSAIALAAVAAAVLGACAPSAGLDPTTGPPPAGLDNRPTDTVRVEWAIALHGGAGTIPQDIPADRKEAYVQALEAALRLGSDALAAGEPALDVVETVVRSLEDEPLFNAGRGAVYTAEGRHELDAAIMDGRDLAAGAVAAVTTVRNPISLARLVMERTDHVLLVGEGAEAFAEEMGVVRVPQEYFHTEDRRRAWERARDRRLEAEREGRRGGGEDDKDTVGVVARDVHGNLAAATSTGGLTDKRWGRVGDVPIIGAGTYADNRTCAVSATGKGEEFIRHNVAHTISARMALRGEALETAAEAVVRSTLQPGDGGVIAVDSRGNLALAFNTTGMYRGAADSTGRFEVGIWQELER